MAYEVSLGVFEGPIDLLLQLITRKRVDIYEVSISTITDEYLRAVDDLDDLDLEAATGFLIVAATLLELKSGRLLPARGVEETDLRLLEERDMLLARLVEVATFREAGAWIRIGLDQGDRLFARTAPLEPHLARLAPDPLERTEPADLARAAAAALAPAPAVEIDTSHVAPIAASVKDAIVEISAALARAGPLSFERLCGGVGQRIEIVVRFLALLEMFKAGAVDLDQADRFGEIVASWTGEVSPEEVALDAEEYTLDLSRAASRGTAPKGEGP